MASWYGGYFDGRRTASGAVYDQDGLSAASRTLPLGTVLRVCRAGTCVQVVVNDRGPYVGDRILDLSRGAARQLGMLSAGVAYVTATPVGRV
jgi:rare lipoprotein A